MIAQFRDQDHTFPSVLMQGPAQVEVRIADGDVLMSVMVAPHGLLGKWCAMSLSLTDTEALATAIALLNAAKDAAEVPHGA